TTAKDDAVKGGQGVKRLHPLGHINTSKFGVLQFTSEFSGEEFFLRDHQVGGRAVLPAAAYVEMVRAAWAKGAAEHEECQRSVELKELVWLRPFVADGQALHVRFMRSDEAMVRFAVYSGASLEAGELYCQGTVSCVESADALESGESGESGESRETRETQWIEDSARNGLGAEQVLSGEALYARYEELGLCYGPAHRGVEQLYVRQGEVVAKLAVPECVQLVSAQFGVHASLLDSALQTGLLLDVSVASLHLPFSLQSVRIVGECPQ